MVARRLYGYAVLTLTWITILAGILFGIVTLFFAEPLLRLMGADQDVIAKGVIYFKIVAIPSVFLALMTVFGSILRSAGDTKTPMKVGIWMNLIHIGLDYSLSLDFSAMRDGVLQVQRGQHPSFGFWEPSYCSFTFESLSSPSRFGRVLHPDSRCCY